MGPFILFLTYLSDLSYPSKTSRQNLNSSSDSASSSYSPVIVDILSSSPICAARQNFVPWNLVRNFYIILRKSFQKHPKTFIRDSFCVWEDVCAPRSDLEESLGVTGSTKNVKFRSQFRIVNQTALHPRNIINWSYGVILEPGSRIQQFGRIL
jgi:hypothetical protein